MTFVFKLLHEKRVWLAAILIWLGILFFLPPAPQIGQEVQHENPAHFDKILHFTYFLAGGIALSIYIFLLQGVPHSARNRVIFSLAFLAAMGACHEFYQSFTPGRSGNDPLDWLADVLGALAGILLTNRFYPLLLKISSPPKNLQRNAFYSARK